MKLKIPLWKVKRNFGIVLVKNIKLREKKKTNKKTLGGRY